MRVDNGKARDGLLLLVPQDSQRRRDVSGVRCVRPARRAGRPSSAEGADHRGTGLRARSGRRFLHTRDRYARDRNARVRLTRVRHLGIRGPRRTRPRGRPRRYPGSRHRQAPAGGAGSFSAAPCRPRPHQAPAQGGGHGGPRGRRQSGRRFTTAFPALPRPFACGLGAGYRISPGARGRSCRVHPRQLGLARHSPARQGQPSVEEQRHSSPAYDSPAPAVGHPHRTSEEDEPLAVGHQRAVQGALRSPAQPDGLTPQAVVIRHPPRPRPRQNAFAKPHSQSVGLRQHISPGTLAMTRRRIGVGASLDGCPRPRDSHRGLPPPWPGRPRTRSSRRGVPSALCALEQPGVHFAGTGGARCCGMVVA